MYLLVYNLFSIYTSNKIHAPFTQNLSIIKATHERALHHLKWSLCMNFDCNTVGLSAIKGVITIAYCNYVGLTYY